MTTPTDQELEKVAREAAGKLDVINPIDYERNFAVILSALRQVRKEDFASAISERDGKWIDKMGACKVCDGEIPYGHTANCDIWKLEQQIAALKQVQPTKDEDQTDVFTIRQAIVALNEIADALETTNRPRAIQLRGTAKVIEGSLVDSIAVSPQEQQGEETGSVYRKKNTITARQFFHVKTPWPVGVCMKHCLDGDWEKPHVHTAHNNQAVIIADGDWVIPEPDGEHYYPCKAEIFEANYERVPPPASTPANPPKEGRASAESEKGLIEEIREAVEGSRGTCLTCDTIALKIDEAPNSCVPNIDTQRETEN